jgi:hypothetical protein
VALLGTLWDDFEDPAISATKWTTTGTVAYTGGKAVLTGGTPNAILQSTAQYGYGTTTNATVFAAKITRTGTGDFSFRIIDTASSARMEFAVEGGILYSRLTNTAGTYVSNVTIGAYNPTTMLWLRPFTVSGGANWHYSADGILWSGTGISTTFGNATTMRPQFINYSTNPTDTLAIEVVGYAPPLDIVQDTFDGTVLDPTKWSTSGSNVTCGVSGGTLNLTTTAGRPTNSNGIVITGNTYRFAESFTFAKIIFPAGSAQYVWLTVKGGVNSAEYFRFVKQGANVQFMGHNGTSVVVNPAATYDPVAMLWWRLQYKIDTVYWDTSPDGINWTNRATWLYALKDVGYKLEFQTLWPSVSSSSVLSFDNANVAPLAPAVLTPDGITDTETLGAPAAAYNLTAAPDSITDPETLDDPQATQDTIAVEPDSITERETIGAPAVTQALTVTPNSITDPETLGLPTIATDLIAAPDNITDNDVPGDPAIITDFPTAYPDNITDPETLGNPEVLFVKEKSNWEYGAGIYNHGPYYGYLVPVAECIPNPTYGSGTYGCGLYYGKAPAAVGEPDMFSDVAAYGPPLHILGIGPWSPRIQWRGIPNRGINAGQLPARPALALPPASSKGFTLRLNEGSEAHTDLAMQRGEAVVIDEMDTDLWWRRKDPRTKKLEVIGRFNCNNVSLATSDTGVNLSAQWEDYATVLGNRMVLKYLKPDVKPNPLSQWDKGTLVTDILAWALPDNTGLDLSEVNGIHPYPLGGISQVYEMPPGILISDVFHDLEAASHNDWEWWIETPEDVNQAPKLRFILGQRGTNKGVTLFDVGSGPTPIASWTRNGASGDYANSLYYTGTGTGTGKDATGGVVEQIPAQIEQYGQRDTQDGNSSVRGDLAQIHSAAIKKLTKLADRRPTYTITLTQGFWRGRDHIDVGDTVTLILRLGEELLQDKYRVAEITVTIDEQGYEAVSLTLGKIRASADPRSHLGQTMRIVRYLKTYQPSARYVDIPDDDE